MDEETEANLEMELFALAFVAIKLWYQNFNPPYCDSKTMLLTVILYSFMYV